MNSEIMTAVVSALVAESDLDIDAETVTADTLLKEDFGLDSMQHLSLLMDLEEKYGFEVEDDEIVALKTVGELVTLIEEKLAGDKNSQP